jgi:hypothetical protein
MEYVIKNVLDILFIPSVLTNITHSYACESHELLTTLYMPYTLLFIFDNKIYCSRYEYINPYNRKFVYKQIFSTDHMSDSNDELTCDADEFVVSYNSFAKLDRHHSSNYITKYKLTIRDAGYTNYGHFISDNGYELCINNYPLKSYLSRNNQKKGIYAFAVYNDVLYIGILENDSIMILAKTKLTIDAPTGDLLTKFERSDNEGVSATKFERSDNEGVSVTKLASAGDISTKLHTIKFEYVTMIQKGKIFVTKSFIYVWNEDKNILYMYDDEHEQIIPIKYILKIILHITDKYICGISNDNYLQMIPFDDPDKTINVSHISSTDDVCFGKNIFYISHRDSDEYIDMGVNIYKIND